MVDAQTKKQVVCAGWEPIYPSKVDQLTLETRNQIISHDEFGLKQGCWTKPVKPPVVAPKE